MTRLQDSADAWQGRIENRSIPSLIAWVVGGLIAVVLLVSVIGFGLGWFNAGKDIVSPTNVKAQFAFAYDSIQGLQAQAGNVCDAQAAYEAETDPFQKTQRQSQLLVYKQSYRRLQQEYNARMDDLFRAKLVAPSDVPKQAPTLTAAMTKAGC